MVEDVEEHNHCVVCGEVTPPGEYFCSEEHRNQLQEQQESAAKKRTIFMVLIIALAVSVIVLSIGPWG